MLKTLGQRVRRRRLAMGVSQAEMARRARVSRRFVVQLESGEANATLMRLADVCAVLSLRFDSLFRGIGPACSQTIALVGMRGAGKSTVGRLLAPKLDVPFVELDDLVEREAGISLAEIFGMRGGRFYRELEAKVMGDILGNAEPKVLAIGGGLVTSIPTWNRLRESARTVWLRASPRAHLERVTEQGDLRPMRGHPHALEELERILDDRAPYYAMADFEIDTDELGVEGTVAAIAGAVDSPGRARRSERG